jgi:predicted RNA-binding protein with PUA-like domain
VSQDPRPEPKDSNWSMVEIRFVKKFREIVPLETLKKTKGLEKMVVVQKGTRLSVQPATKAEYDIVAKLGR